MGNWYIAIDLKSFYASVECAERKLDPLSTNLVVADASRTEKTICLAVSPALREQGIPGRARLFEVVSRVGQINAARREAIKGAPFRGASADGRELAADPFLKLDYLTATPRMQLYMDYSTRIYNIYLRFVAPEDIHVYSIDEVMIDVTSYLRAYGVTARELCARMIRTVMAETGITATGGVGTNLYLCKIAMDIMAKHMEPSRDGVRIAQLDEMDYRRYFWTHRPLTDFWRVGPGIARKLEKYGLFTMGDIARRSLEDEELLYKLLGVNAQHLINHAWGFEDVTMAAVRDSRPKSRSLGSGQVLQKPYSFEKGRLIVREMTELLVLDLVDKGLVTDQMILTVGYDIENLADPAVRKRYRGEITKDWYGRQLPKHAHGSVNLARMTSSTRLITEAVTGLYDRIVDPALLVRRISIAANHVADEAAEREKEQRGGFEQLDLFTDYEAQERERQKEEEQLAREREAQRAVLKIQKKYGKNAILKGMNLEEGAMTRERNRQIGGHKA